MSVSDTLLEFARTEGIGSNILKLTTILNKTSIDETSRVLLGTPGVYESILLKLFREQHVPSGDASGLVPSILVGVQDEPRRIFYEELVSAFSAANHLSISGAVRERFLKELSRRGVPLAAGKTGRAMQALFKEVTAEGDLPSYVDQYATRGEIDEDRFTAPVKRSMVDFLEAAGIQGIDDTKFNRGDYDEYFAQAYYQAVFAGRTGGETTPPVVVPPAGDEFRLPTYEFGDDQGVVPASIHVAAVAYQIFMIGDKLGMLEMPNALLARRARGKLDLPSGNASTLLQEYKKFQRAEDVEPEERMLLYKRVFSLGGGNVLEDTVVNEEFPALWDSLMKEVTNFITKDEMSSAVEDRISRSAIYEAIRNLQVNLSFYAADIDEDVRVMMKQYQLAENILRNPEVMSAIGLVRRQTLQAVIERLLSDDAGSVPKVKAMFTLGTKGQEILHFIADFDESLPEDQFQRFLRLSESWIIARSSLQEQDLGIGEQSEDTGGESDAETDETAEDWEA